MVRSTDVLVDEKNHEAKKEAYKEAAEERGVIGQIGDTLSNAYHYVTEKVSGHSFVCWSLDRYR
jgi:hypothetical protein